jgi:hypothetical protein
MNYIPITLWLKKTQHFVESYLGQISLILNGILYVVVLFSLSVAFTSKYRFSLV